MIWNSYRHLCSMMQSNVAASLPCDLISNFVNALLPVALKLREVLTQKLELDCMKTKFSRII